MRPCACCKRFKIRRLYKTRETAVRAAQRYNVEACAIFKCAHGYVVIPLPSHVVRHDTVEIRCTNNDEFNEKFEYVTWLRSFEIMVG